MPLWGCDITDCLSHGVRRHGDCKLCGSHLCLTHLQSEHHQCPRVNTEEYEAALGEAVVAELEELVRTINFNALAETASALRHGIPCSVKHPDLDKPALRSSMGAANFHVEIVFEDGVSWIARLKRHNSATPPPAVRSYMIKSEVATYAFLRTTSVPVPGVFAFASDPNNPVGREFILMERVRGKTLPSMLPTPEQMRKVLAQLAEVYTELRRYPFPAMGSLDSPGSTRLGPIAHDLLVDMAITISSDYSNQQLANFSGPFGTLREYYAELIPRILDMIVAGELYPFWVIDAFLIHRFLFDLLVRVPWSEQIGETQEFYLRHFDDKGDHIMVDEDFNITGIIDWEGAYTAQETEAFTSPLALWEQAAFFSESNALSYEELVFADLLDDASSRCANQPVGDHGLGHCVRLGKIFQRFRICVGYSMYDGDMENYRMAFLGLLRAFEDLPRWSWDEWKFFALQRYTKDQLFQQLLERESRSKSDVVEWYPG